MLVLLLAFFTLVSADAAETLPSQTEQAAAINDTINEISALEIEIEKARQDQLDVLSPDWFAKAETSMNKAKSGAEKGSVLAKIREYIADTREYLKNAEETAKVARTMLPQVLESRRKAHLAGAAKLTKEYADVEDQFLKLTKAIEKNNIKYTQKNALNVEQAYKDLELLAIKNNAIGNAREIVTLSEKDKAEKYAPQALELAQRRLSEADDFITKDRYATDEIKNKAQAAMFSANRVRVLTDQSKKFEMMTPEDTSLWVEDVLSKITTWLSAKDSRDQDLESQLGNIQQSITTLKDDNKNISDQLTSTHKELAETRTSYEARIDSLNQKQKAKEMLLADQKVKESTLIKDKERILAEQKAMAQTLEDERRFNQKYIEIQKSFSTDEAEVYKRGNQLIVRLKGIQFPVGTAVIMPENYQLLSKVQRAIKLFEDPSVFIEGHSDSTGSDEINLVLSQQRADAVMDYLIANNTLTKNKVVAMGYGSSKPVASNSNPEGRAANRRIDVIVTPALRPQM